jgi:hypothetical protein
METTKKLPPDKQAMLDKFNSSGKSIKQYCLDENIPYHLMSYWQRKEKYLKTGKDKKFIKVKFKEPSQTAQNKTELIFSNGNRIIFHGHVNMNELKQLASTSSATNR